MDDRFQDAHIITYFNVHISSKIKMLIIEHFWIFAFSIKINQRVMILISIQIYISQI